MRYRNLFLLYGLIFLFCLSQAARAAHDSESGNAESTSSQGERATAPKEVTDEMYLLLGKFNPSVAYLTRRFAKTLPDALAKSMAPKTNGDDILLRSDDSISTDLAELLGQISDAQKEKLYAELIKLPSDPPLWGCDSGDAEKRTAIDTLRTRVLWALDFILKKKKDDRRPACVTRADEFIKAFEPKWKKVLKDNDEFHDKMELALAGNKEAIDFVSKKYPRDAVLGFLENHSDGGNKELANHLTLVLAEKNEQGHFIDAESPTGEKTRIVLGRDPKKFADRITELKKDPVVKGIARYVRAEKPYDKPDAYLVPASLKKTFKLPAKGSETGSRGSAGGSSGGGSGGSSDGTSGTASSSVKNTGNTLIVNSCLSCHSGATPKGGFRMNAEGRYSKDEADRIIARSQGKEEGMGPMPPKALLSADQQKEIESYLRATR